MVLTLTAIQRAVDSIVLIIGGQNKNITLSISVGEYLIIISIPIANIVGDGIGKTLIA